MICSRCQREGHESKNCSFDHLKGCPDPDCQGCVRTSTGKAMTPERETLLRNMTTFDLASVDHSVALRFFHEVFDYVDFLKNALDARKIMHSDAVTNWQEALAELNTLRSQIKHDFVPPDPENEKLRELLTKSVEYEGIEGWNEFRDSVRVFLGYQAAAPTSTTPRHPTKQEGDPGRCTHGARLRADCTACNEYARGLLANSRTVTAVTEAGFRVSTSGTPTLWCTECGRDSGFHWDKCSKADAERIGDSRESEIRRWLLEGPPSSWCTYEIRRGLADEINEASIARLKETRTNTTDCMYWDTALRHWRPCKHPKGHTGDHAPKRVGEVPA